MKLKYSESHPLKSCLLIWEFFIPLNRNHGHEFNSEREKLGIPTLKADWEKDKYQSKKFPDQADLQSAQK